MKDDEEFYKFIGNYVHSFVRLRTSHLDDPDSDLVEMENNFTMAVTDWG